VPASRPGSATCRTAVCAGRNRFRAKRRAWDSHPPLPTCFRQPGRAPFLPRSSESVQSFGSTWVVYVRRCVAVRSCSVALLLARWRAARSLSPRPVTKQLLFPRRDWPVAWRMHSENSAADPVEHFPAVCSQLILNPERQLAAAFLEYSRLGVVSVPGGVPCLQVIEQPGSQPLAPRPGTIEPSRRLDADQPSSCGRSLLLFFSKHPPDAVRPVIPVDEHPARLCHAPSLPGWAFGRRPSSASSRALRSHPLRPLDSSQSR
jgi:hypothetical protein